MMDLDNKIMDLNNDIEARKKKEIGVFLEKILFFLVKLRNQSIKIECLS